MDATAVPEAAARAATHHDLSVVTSLAERAESEKVEQKGGAVWSRRERLAHTDAAVLAETLEATEGRVAVGMLDQSVVGYGVVRAERLADGGLLGVVHDLYVEPAARGLGVGEALMNHLMDWCRSAGCFGVDSVALPGDRETKNFFESFGLVARAIIVHRSLK